MIKQPETRPISQEQLVAEVKGIYAGLVMVESKCIEVDNAQSSANEGSKLNNDQWQALIALHRTLLHEHHDFFLASQHPSASPALRRLASKYAMPARMWRHGIHSFLELLRHRLPASLEHMLTFIYLAYSMMALLYETVPNFEDTWIECLGDLGRYRMAIEDDDLKDREVWTAVSRHWYSRASDKSPATGRLYHHLAILARPNALQQLFYYTKSLCVPIPFLSARESIMTLFEPHLSGAPTRLADVDAAFVRAHGILFSGRNNDQLASSIQEFLDKLDNHIARTTVRWTESGYYIGIALSCSLLEYGSESNILMRSIKSGRTHDVDISMDDSENAMTQKFFNALDFTARTHTVVFQRFGDENVDPYLHVTLSFLKHLSQFPTAMGHIEEKVPWKLIALMLNTFVTKSASVAKFESDIFPRPEKETHRPIPDDYALRGLIWTEDYYPSDWFTGAKVDDDEKYFEVPSMKEERRERCLWLGARVASSGKWLTYDESAKKFGVPSKYEVEVLNPSTKDSMQHKEGDDGDVEIMDAPVPNK
ncbi:EST/SMG-like protein 1 [Colletotrichum chlorophyti]|uniref:EST/SMG-like protein 1 n=1 Tax=Colletotrichum chlorophyti TaxID=708187 RepID=A0A1Q8S554_9PEZI|nr:EST/SMG-like protein 1 [Colletotrichum chlorophyti]